MTTLDHVLCGCFDIEFLNAHKLHNDDSIFSNKNQTTMLLPSIWRPNGVDRSSCTLMDNVFFNISDNFESVACTSDETDHYQA